MGPSLSSEVRSAFDSPERSIGAGAGGFDVEFAAGTGATTGAAAGAEVCADAVSPIQATKSRQALTSGRCRVS